MTDAEIRELNIHQRLYEIKREFGHYLQKRPPGPGVRSPTIAQADVIRKVAGLMDRYRVNTYVDGVNVLENSVVTMQQKAGPKNHFRVLIEYRFAFQNIDDTDDRVLQYAVAEGLDDRDWGTSKARTYAEKMVYLTFLQMEAGGDPDMTALDVDVLMDEETAQRVGRVKQLAEALCPEDPQSMIRDACAAAAKRMTRPRCTLAGIPKPMLDEIIGAWEKRTKTTPEPEAKAEPVPKAEDVADQKPAGNGSATKAPKARNPAPPAGEPVHVTRLRELACLVIDKNKHATDLTAQPAVVAWLGQEGAEVMELENDQVYDMMKTKVEAMSSGAWGVYLLAGAKT